ncbi:MAG: cyclic pyranopterin monophosphate synthase MoaC [Nitrospirae bacterium]|nr:cyclic pyranopterin monophosphate synthase MoaC [Nitrospirota bacterium]
MKRLTHMDKKGRVKMVDVSEKKSTLREAAASGAVIMNKETLKLITDKKITKGDVLETARLAGIMAAKKACDIIPLCHQLNLLSVGIEFKADKRKGRIDIEAKAKCKGETGVEMEALVAASVAALTIYDMCKAVDRGMVISDIMLLKKSGGKSGTWER